MRCKVFSILGLTALLAAPLVAAEKAKAVVDPQDEAAQEAEINYVEAMINHGYPDFAGPVIEAIKKRWPSAEARLFAIEVRGMLSLGQFDAAEKKIGALPDRKSTKFWAARLEVAKSYFSRNQKAECMKIYEAFFKTFPTPPADIRKFYLDASYEYGQLLAADKQYAKAVTCYANLFKEMKEGDDAWCNIGCEAVDLYLKLADKASDPKDAATRKGYLDAATKIVDKLLWQLDKPVYFGRAVSMKAHIEQLKGDPTRAAQLIDDYKPQLTELHESIMQIDPDGNLGLLKQSPLPECLYLQAKILWDAAQKEYKAPKRDDEKIKTYLFGPKIDGSKKRAVAKGAFAMAQGVFLNYEMSSWAPQAGDLAQDIKKFAEEKYNAKIKTNVTPEQIAKVRAAQFREANEKFLGSQYVEAIDAYFAVLAKYPELEESIQAIENVANAYIDLAQDEKDPLKKAEYRMNADTVEGYLAERFAGAENKILMTSAGDAAARLAAKESEYKNLARANRLYTDIITHYREHPNAAALAASKGGEAVRNGKWAEAMKFWQLIGDYYTNSAYYAASLMQRSMCSGKLGDKAQEIAYLKAYIPLEQIELRKIQAQMQLAQILQKDGLDILANAGTNATPEVVEEAEKTGSAQILRAIQQFSEFDKEIDAAIKDPATSKKDLVKYLELKESGMFITGECWSRLTKPADKLQMYRQKAAECYEAYLKAYPKGKYAKAGYVKLGTIYTALGDAEKSRSALDRLSKEYPNSDEAKNAKPRLAKNLIEMGMRQEGAAIYAEMLKTDGAYTPLQFEQAGEALVDAKDWDLANQAFNLAIKQAGTNNLSVVARARLGLAKAAWKQGSYAEARDALDRFFADPNMTRLALAADANFMLVEIASEQGKQEKDETQRGKYFGAAIGALKKVRQYWAKKENWEQDTLDLLSGDVLVNQMKAEESMGLKEAALETCGRAAATFQVFIQAHGVNEDHPIDKMSEGEKANLERAYATLVPLFSKMGAEQADRVMKFGNEYLSYFPEGKARTEIENCINQAKADLPQTKTTSKE